MRRWLSFVIVLILLTVPFSADAAETGSLTLLTRDGEGNAVDLTVELCQIAVYKNRYDFTAAFEASGISLKGLIEDPSPLNASSLLSYVQKQKIQGTAARSVGGSALFEDLEQGIYIVWCDEKQEYCFDPFILFLPQRISDELDYDVSAAPKLSPNTPDSRNIHVMKRWEDHGVSSVLRPRQINVTLLRGDTPVREAVLSKENGWSYTFTNLPQEGLYSVRESAVQNYSPHYGGSAKDGFVITNTFSGASLPQTGQLWWPVAVILIAGLCFIGLGIMQLRGTKNEEK